MGLLPDTQTCGLRMRRECREPFHRHRLQRKPLVSDPGMHHGTCVTHVTRCMSGSLARGGGENIPGIPGACASRNYRYLVRGLCNWKSRNSFMGYIVDTCWFIWLSRWSGMCVLDRIDIIVEYKPLSHRCTSVHWQQVGSYCLSLYVSVHLLWSVGTITPAYTGERWFFFFLSFVILHS